MTQGASADNGEEPNLLEHRGVALSRQLRAWSPVLRLLQHKLSVGVVFHPILKAYRQRTERQRNRREWVVNDPKVPTVGTSRVQH